MQRYRRGRASGIKNAKIRKEKKEKDIRRARLYTIQAEFMHLMSMHFSRELLQFFDSKIPNLEQKVPFSKGPNNAY